MTGPHIRYTSPMGKVTVLRAETLKSAKALFRYASKVATAVMTIDLMDGPQVLDTFSVPE